MRRLSIRAKFAAILILFAVLPLLVGAIVSARSTSRLRIRTLGESFRTAAASGALAMEVSLSKDVQTYWLWLDGEPMVVQSLEAINQPLTPDRLQELDRIWPQLQPNAEPMMHILDNDMARHLQELARADNRVAEVLLTDRNGNLVAATGRTSDFYQGDEDWWRLAYNGGRGQLVITPIRLDVSSGVEAVEICVPITGRPGVVGVAKVTLSIDRWIESLHMPARMLSADSVITDESGRIIHEPNDESDGAYLMGQTLPEWEGLIAQGSSGWRISTDGHLQGFSPVALAEHEFPYPITCPLWVHVVYQPVSIAMTELRRINLEVLGASIAMIVLLFIVAVLVGDRLLVRRIQRLEVATRAVADGDLAHRIEVGRKRPPLGGYDEVDDLERDFDQMVSHIQQTHDQLVETDDLKSNFLRVAGHELRTPVSYILGMTRLLRDVRDVDRLQFGMQAMAAKARRLERIIESMFKLMIQRELRGQLHFEPVRVDELLEQAYIETFLFIQKRDQHLVINNAPDLPTIVGDKDLLLDAVENLLINAVKFTPDGGQITMSSSMEEPQQVTISVQDQGTGIPPRDIPHMFEPFFSGRDVLQHSSGDIGYQKRGMGLGLAVVRHFVNLHGGGVTFTTGTSGTTFTIHLPIRPPDAPPLEEVQSPQSAAAAPTEAA